jgi:endogenous inhibitor of DNA gyrase (YacG/DUF329 family)
LTTEQKEMINGMRSEGHSYSQIAVYLDISENTVKSFCRRNNLQSKALVVSFKEDITKVDNVACKNCGKPLKQKPKQKQKKFCSDKCRFEWWSNNKESLNKKAMYNIRCCYCGNEFESYGNKNRKYCKHSCFIMDRYKKVGDSVDQRTV